MVPTLRKRFSSQRIHRYMTSSVEEILSKFPGPVTIKSSRLKIAALLLIAIVMAGTSLYLLEFEQNPRYRTWLAAWGILIFFSVGIPIFAVMLLPNASYLKLGPREFELVSLFKKARIPWRNAMNFRLDPIMPMNNKKMLVFDYTPLPGEQISKWLGAIARGRGALPGTYRLNQADLADLMNQWRERALR
jgi:hypothetical protein